MCTDLVPAFAVESADIDLTADTGEADQATAEAATQEAAVDAEAEADGGEFEDVLGALMDLVPEQADQATEAAETEDAGDQRRPADRGELGQKAHRWGMPNARCEDMTTGEDISPSGLSKTRFSRTSIRSMRVSLVIFVPIRSVT